MITYTFLVTNDIHNKVLTDYVNSLTFDSIITVGENMSFDLNLFADYQNCSQEVLNIFSKYIVILIVNHVQLKSPNEICLSVRILITPTTYV
jgi:hypothetical protein